MSFETKPLSLTVSEIFSGECDSMVDKGQGQGHFDINRFLTYDFL